MAGTIQGSDGLFDDYTRDQASEARIINLACFSGGTPAQVQTARAQMLDTPDFTINATTTAAETFAAIELMTAKGVSFPAGYGRLLEIDFYVSGNAADETGWARHTAFVSGGTTPIVRVVTVPASTPVQVGGNTLSGVAGAGFAATPAVTVVAGAGTVTVNVVSAEAETLNWVVEVRIGKLRKLRAGI